MQRCINDTTYTIKNCIEDFKNQNSNLTEKDIIMCSELEALVERFNPKQKDKKENIKEETAEPKNEPKDDDEQLADDVIVELEIDTENIPSLYIKFLENQCKENSIKKIDNYLETEFDTTMNLNNKYTGKRSLRQKFNEIKIRYKYRRSIRQSVLNSMKKKKLQSMNDSEANKIKSIIIDDRDRLKNGEKIQSNFVKKYLKRARNEMAKTLNIYRLSKYESGLNQYDKKLELLEEYEKNISKLRENGEGFEIVFSRDEQYVDENGNFRKVKNTGEKHFVKYESILEQLQATKNKVLEEKNIAKSDMEKEDELAK